MMSGLFLSLNLMFARLYEVKAGKSTKFGANKQELKQRKKQRREDSQNRTPIEGRFEQGKNGYRLNAIRVRLQKTSET